MADDVLINFVGDTSKLQPLENSLDNLIDKNDKVAESWQKTSEVMNDQGKQSTETTNKLAKSIDQLAVATKNMDKSVIAGAYKQYLKQIQDQLGLTNKELIKYVENARKAAQAQIIQSTDQKEIDDLNLSIQVMNEQLVTLQKNEQDTGDKATYLRTQLQAAKEAFAELIAKGIESGPVFDAAKAKLTDLAEQNRIVNETTKNLGSEHKGLDGLIDLARGVAGGFAVAEGAMALFGDENEDVRKALVRLNGAMAILQGLQEVQNVLQKSSAASLLFNIGAKKAETVATVAQTGALEGEVVATEAATVAQEELNVAMSLNPVGLLIIGILAAVAALTLFHKEEETAAEKTERLTKESEHLLEELNKIAKVSEKGVNRTVQIEQNKAIIDQLTAEGAAVEKINDIKKKNIELENASLKLELFNIKAAQEGEGEVNQFTERELAVKTKIFENDQAQLLLDIETNKVLAERALKSASNEADAEVARRKMIILKNQVDSLASIKAVNDAEIQAIRAKEAEALNAERLTQGEIDNIKAQANLKVLELQRSQQRKILELQKTDLNTQLLQAQKGSEEEFNIKIKQLEKDKQLELQKEELTQGQILEIKARYKKLEEDLNRQFAEKRIENEISFLNSYLDAFGLTEDRKLELTIRRLDRQRDLEISQAEGNAAKIKEIQAKYDKLILDAKKAAIKAELDEKLKALDIFNHQEIAAANKVLQNDNSTFAEKKAASDRILKLDLDRINTEQVSLEKEKAKGVITEKDYNLAIEDLANQRADATIAAEKRVTDATIAEANKQVAKLQAVFGLFQTSISAILGEGIFSTAIQEMENFAAKAIKIQADIKAGLIKGMEAVKAIAAAAITSAATVINQIFADASAKRAQIAADEIAALQEQKDRELNVLNLTKQQQADIENRYRQRERQIKIEQFNADKQAKRSQALINGALGATLAFAEYAWPYSLVVAGIIAALTAVEVSQINSQQPPRFKHGKVNIDGPGTATSDSIHAMISKGESVINAPQTAKWMPALEAINSDKFEQYMAAKMNDFIFPQVPDHVYAAGSGGVAIDYNVLAKAVAAEMRGIIPAPAQVTNTIDKDGFHSFVRDGSNRTEYKNKRYSMGS